MPQEEKYHTDLALEYIQRIKEAHAIRARDSMRAGGAGGASAGAGQFLETQLQQSGPTGDRIKPGDEPGTIGEVRIGSVCVVMISFPRGSFPRFLARLIDS